MSYLTDDNSNENLLGCGYGVIHANTSATKLYREEKRKKAKTETDRKYLREKISILFIVKSECGQSRLTMKWALGFGVFIDFVSFRCLFIYLICNGAAKRFHQASEPKPNAYLSLNLI